MESAQMNEEALKIPQQTYTEELKYLDTSPLFGSHLSKGGHINRTV